MSLRYAYFISLGSQNQISMLKLSLLIFLINRWTNYRIKLREGEKANNRLSMIENKQWRKRTGEQQHAKKKDSYIGAF